MFASLNLTFETKIIGNNNYLFISYKDNNLDKEAIFPIDKKIDKTNLFIKIKDSLNKLITL